MTKKDGKTILSRVYHGIIDAYYDDDRYSGLELSCSYKTDFLYYQHKGIPIAIKLIDNQNKTYEISCHFHYCQEYRKYPIVLFLRPNKSYNAKFASNYNTACFSLTNTGTILPFKIVNNRILLGVKEYSLDDFVCTSKYIFNQNIQWVEKDDKTGIVDVIDEFYKDDNHYNCYILDGIEFYDPVEQRKSKYEINQSAYKQKLKELFDNKDYNKLFSEFYKIEKDYYLRHNIKDIDTIEDYQQDCNILIWEEIINGDFIHGNNIPKYVRNVCFNKLREKQKKFATRERILKKNPDFISSMKESRNDSDDRYVSFAPKRKKRSNLSTIFVYDKNTNQLIGEFDSIIDASKATGADRGNISRCLHGKIKSSNGCVFSFNCLKKHSL